MNATAQENDGGKSQAESQLSSIMDMVAALHTDDEDERETAETAIHEDALSIEVRGPWYTPRGEENMEDAAEYRILLCFGGPAVRIIGDLVDNSPGNASIEYQDWFTPWTALDMTSEQEHTVIEYAQQFLFE